MKHRQLIAAALSATLMGTTASVKATASSLTDRMVTGVGRIIAAQGNNALHEIRDELMKNFSKTLKPVLPELHQIQTESASGTGAEAALRVYVQMHAQARAAQ